MATAGGYSRLSSVFLWLEQDISGVEFKSMPSGLHNVNEDLVYGRQLTFLMLGTL